MSVALATAVLDRAVLDLKGLEADNLMAFVGLLGLLRALETVQPAWAPRVSWHQPPWTARLHLAESVDEAAIARAANAGIEEIAEALAPLGHELHAVEMTAPAPTARKSDSGNTQSSSSADEKGVKDIWNVNLPPRLYRALAAGYGDQAVAALLLAALAGEHPVGREGYVALSPYVLTRGQGHQRFLEDLFAMLGVTSPASKDVAGAERILELERSLFQPWRRADARGGFRWDPAEDRRHALRFREPSKEGTRTEIGAMRLAAAGFLSLVNCPTGRYLVTKGVVRTANALYFMWPLWTAPLTREAVEVLLGHPSLLTEHPDLRQLAPLGIAEVMRAARVRSGKYTSIGRGEPICGSGVVRLSAQPTRGTR